MVTARRHSPRRAAQIALLCLLIMLLAPLAWAEEAAGELFAVLATTDETGFVFYPEALSVAPGDSVIWLNLSDVHTVTAYHPANGSNLRIPEEAEPFDSGYFGLDIPGSTFVYTFSVAGVYDYYCDPHERFGMVGRVVAGRDFPIPEYATAAASQRVVGGESRSWFVPVETVTGAVRASYRWEALLYLPLAQAVDGKIDRARETARRLFDRWSGAGQDTRELKEMLKQSGNLDEFEREFDSYIRTVVDSRPVGEMISGTKRLRSVLTGSRR